MQTKALHTVLEHLHVTFDFDNEETRKLLGMLHKTLIHSVPVLRSEETDSIYHTSHKLHSELHMCGYESLSELATEIELNAKKGIIERTVIDDFLAKSQAFSVAIENWLTS